jgi:hypothetical protein
MPVMCQGFGKLNKHIEANLDWWMVEIVDGSMAHLIS